jgi:hypothetical protein
MPIHAKEGSGMYATIVRCEMHHRSAARADGRAGRTLTTALAALPGFVAVVAIETDAEAGTATAVCLMEEHAGLAAAERVIAQWQQAHVATGKRDVQRMGAGEVIAQWGL